MNEKEFYNKVKKGDIVVLRKDLKTGKRYGTYVYRDILKLKRGYKYLQMPRQGEVLEYDFGMEGVGFAVKGYRCNLDPEMVDYIAGLEKEEVTPEKVEELTQELKQARGKLENVQKEFDKLKCLLEEISKDK